MRLVLRKDDALSKMRQLLRFLFPGWSLVECDRAARWILSILPRVNWDLAELEITRSGDSIKLKRIALYQLVYESTHGDQGGGRRD